MIVFGSSITDPAMYDKAAGPGIELAREPDSIVHALSAAGSIYRTYNLLLERAAAHEQLEALVLVHQDTEIADPEFCAKIRRCLQDPAVGAIGCVGAVGVRSIAWWDGSVTWASFTHRYGELGGGQFDSFCWKDSPVRPAYATTGEVDTIDGFLMVLSPWVVRNLRFDESLGMLHGYDFDFCLTVREAGRKIVTEELYAVHHHSLDLINNPDTWVQAHMAIAEKWEGRMPGVGVESTADWKTRARRAEAEAAVQRAFVVSEQMKNEALERQLGHEFRETISSLSWRITEPLRRANQARRTLAAKQAERRRHSRAPG